MEGGGERAATHRSHTSTHMSISIGVYPTLYTLFLKALHYPLHVIYLTMHLWKGPTDGKLFNTPPVHNFPQSILKSLLDSFFCFIFGSKKMAENL